MTDYLHSNVVYRRVLNEKKHFMGFCPNCHKLSGAFQIPCKNFNCECKAVFTVVGSLEFCGVCQFRIGCLTRVIVESL